MEGKESESKADAPDSKGARAKPNEHQSKMNGDEAQTRAGTSQKKPKENGGQVNGEGGAGEAAAAAKQRPKPKKSLPPGTDLWARITHEVNESKKEGNEPQAVESFGLLLGERGAGKSSLVQSFLNPSKGPDDRPKPSVALEYQFARRAGGAAAKDVAHLWELGGGMQATELIRVAITPKQLQHAAFVVCVDLGRPENALGDLLRWLAVARRHMADCLRLIAKKRPPLAEAIRKAMVRRLAMADDNPDKRLIDPAPVPLVIVANKYDLFKDHAGVKRKALWAALRFVAHLNGATLLACSAKEKALRDGARAALNAALFRAPLPRRLLETNGERPVVVPAGQDSMAAILRHLPERTTAADFVSAAGVAPDAIPKWKKALAALFGPPTAPEGGGGGAGGAEGDEGEEEEKGSEPNGFPEPLVDEVRAQRDQA
eukprot:CAMPEP_0206402062 /NCGR_PEP_ID=MMETSP0294-20121207/26708_1 /ASSEMBLY_ACC=CAM_ASM_000327 /TAXON_ID=39354 /ORGANISM="Heterosigma akashiwo, Strain CCMP2393" /LENGTH=429 /DNA_ID=CAMNT_0053859015 /DNA_START=143 /DNA_END=1429 /DNA_ORIENTATION=-